jgi:hypothetical protein
MPADDLPQIQQVRGWLMGDLMPDHDTFTMGREFAAALLLELDSLRETLIFADGLSVALTRQHTAHVTSLADVYGEASPAQGVIARAGCHPRGSFRGE